MHYDNQLLQIQEFYSIEVMIGSLVKTSIPTYLSGLPVPDSFTGWFKLSLRDWIALIPPTAALAGVGYTVYMGCRSTQPRSPSKTSKCNFKIRTQENIVVDTIDIENITQKAAFCRCWRSKNWPYCDGSHNSHNKNIGDNIGPLVLKKRGSQTE